MNLNHLAYDRSLHESLYSSVVEHLTRIQKVVRSIPSGTQMFFFVVPCYRGTKRLVSVNICSVESNSAGIFDSKVSPRIFVVKEK